MVWYWGRPVQNQELDLGDPYRCLLTQGILWFYVLLSNDLCNQTTLQKAWSSARADNLLKHEVLETKRFQVAELSHMQLNPRH